MRMTTEEQLEKSKSRTPQVLKNIEVKQELGFPTTQLLRRHISDTRKSFLFAGGAKPSDTEFERILGTNDLVDEFFFERALLAGRPVCRIQLRDDFGATKGWATGFMVSPRLMLTNHHVFAEAGDAAPSLAEFNYRLGIAGQPEQSHKFKLRPDLYFHANPDLDYAIVAVETESLDGAAKLSSFGFHRLLARAGKVVEKEWLSIVQHPGGAFRQWAIRENQCIDASDPNFLWYMSDTAPGSSGAAVLNDSFQVVALHHSGKAQQDADGRYVLKDGNKTDSLAGVDEDLIIWIANEGVRISSICASLLADAKKDELFPELQAAMEGGDVLSTAYSRSNAGEKVMAPAGPASAQINAGRLEIGTLVLELNDTDGVRTVLSSSLLGGAFEGLKEPIVDRDYTNRTGFNTSFLDVPTPLPDLVDKKKAATMVHSSEYLIPYEHFTVVLHAERKLPIFTASNVDWSKSARTPDPSQAYARKPLGGLGKNDQEKWMLDTRIAAEHQIPDSFYTNDNQAFDKGHLVRRDDVCWGSEYSEIRRANGDTYHVTNCSPQVKSFNRSTDAGIWGQLENLIGGQSGAGRLCIFAGPILADEDEVFEGTEKIKIPSRYWKVICAISEGELKVYPFLLEQELAPKLFEFSVPPEWKIHMTSLEALQKIIRLLEFPAVYHNADQGKNLSP